MKNFIKSTLRLSALVAILVAVLSINPLLAAPQAVPLGVNMAATLPASTCTPTGPTTRTCEFWAKPGTLTLADSNVVNIWGYTDSASGAAQLPGPTVIANQGDTITMILHNDLTVATAMVFPGFLYGDVQTDGLLVPSGGSATYILTANSPGTFMYEAGMLEDSAIQVSMGLFGPMIVRPGGAPDRAYNDVSTQFNDEALLVFSEIDPDLNANPMGFDMRDYKPEYRLINGLSYPDTATVDTLPGNTVLLRLLNAGLVETTFSLLGLRHEIVGLNGNPLTFPYSVVAESVAAGESFDSLVTIPADTADGTMFPFYESGSHTHNAGRMTGTAGPIAVGGALTFITVPTGAPGPDVLGPLVSGAVMSPAITDGALGSDLSGTLSDFSTGGNAVSSGEFFIDTVGVPGTGTALVGTFGTTSVAFSANLSSGDLAALAKGEHIVYIRGLDDQGNWGPIGAASLNLVESGPSIWGMSLDPSPTNGDVNVRLQATGDGRPSGNANVVQAEYFIGATGADGTGTPMAVNAVMPVASLTADLSAADVAALSEGEHPIFVHALDDNGKWGTFGEIVLSVDKTGPSANPVTIAPNPNNGFLGINVEQQYVRLEATLVDPESNGTSSNLATAEYFLNTVRADGTGTGMISVDGLFNESSETAYLHIPLSGIRSLPTGEHTFYVHAKDSAGNWGDLSSAVLIVDKLAPEMSSLAFNPSPADGVGAVIFTAFANDPLNDTAPASNIVAAEGWFGIDPGKGLGTPLLAADGTFNSPSEALVKVVDISGWPAGNYEYSVRAKDAAGNWSAASKLTLTVLTPAPATVLASDFNDETLAEWSQVVGQVSALAQASQGTGSGMGLAATLGAPAYVADQSPAMDMIYAARFLFDPNDAALGDQTHSIFLGLDASDQALFGIDVEQSGPGEYEVRAWVTHRQGTAYTEWFDIDNGSNTIELRWSATGETELELMLGTNVMATFDNLDTRDYLLDEVRLGAVSGVTADMNGLELFDSFRSTRSERAIYDHFLPLISR